MCWRGLHRKLRSGLQAVKQGESREKAPAGACGEQASVAPLPNCMQGLSQSEAEGVGVLSQRPDQFLFFSDWLLAAAGGVHS